MEAEEGVGEDLAQKMRSCAYARKAMMEVLRARLKAWRNGPLSDPPDGAVKANLERLLLDVQQGVRGFSQTSSKSCARSKESREIGFLVIWTLVKLFSEKYNDCSLIEARVARYLELFNEMVAGKPMPEDARETVEEMLMLFEECIKMGKTHARERSVR